MHDVRAESWMKEFFVIVIYSKKSKKIVWIYRHVPLPGKNKKLPYVFLGDEAFPLTQNIIKPYSGPHPPGSKQKIFTIALIDPEK